jgi:hypothetical protein
MTVVSQAIFPSGTDLFSPGPMTAVLTPDLALAYLAELSNDFRAGAVLDAGGRTLAGDPALAAGADGLLEIGDDEGSAPLPDGEALLVARSSTHTILVRAGRHGIAALMLADMRAVLGDLA